MTHDLPAALTLARAAFRAARFGSRGGVCGVVGFLLMAGGCGDDSGGGGDGTSKNRLVGAGTLTEGQEINENAFNSAQVCGFCHQAIHASWQQSMHSRAWSNGIFQAAYRETEQIYPKGESRLCLTCHAPTARETEDYAVEAPITREGVTCDFCHSIRGVDLANTDEPYDLHVGRTKYGPLKHAQSPVHEIVDSELHKRSELCAPCHEFQNQHGVAVLTTYSEWKASPYAAEGKQCQDCHMPIIPGRVVALGLEDTARDGVNLHDISGSHDLERVRKAVKMKIRGVTRLAADKTQVRIDVTNEGSGHRFPTGLPLRWAILEVNLSDRGSIVARREIEFKKVLLNERGVPVTREHEAFLSARSVGMDTRLKPKERRTVRLTFDGVRAPEGVVEATLWYYYSTHAVKTDNGVETVEPVEMKFLLASEKRRLRGAGG